MSTPQKTPEGKWILFHPDTGQRLTRWPVDGRELLSHGYLARDPLAAEEVVGDEEVPAADPMPHVTQATQERAAMSPTGAPLIVSPPGTASAAHPVQLPTQAKG